MKKQAISLAMSALMVLSLSTTVFATSPISKETPVSYTGIGTHTYELSVPSLLQPSGSGEVKLYGTWDSTKTINVTTDKTIIMTNDIDSKTKELVVTFNDISQTGSNTAPIEVTENISVGEITEALFGTWSGNIVYNISIEEEPKELEAGLYDIDGNMLCTWEESGIDVEKDYTEDTCKTDVTSPYYVITNAYPTATKVVLPDSVTRIGNRAFYDCTGLTSITIGNGATSIGDWAFRNCTELTSVTIGNGVTSIGRYAFYNCTDLTSVTIGNGVTSIGDSAFSNCTGLTSITIPNSVTSIGEYAFNGCNLTSIAIPDSVTSIGRYAFGNCTGLTSITIPNSVTSIGQGAFVNCTDLTSITVSEENTTYDSRNNCNAIIETSTGELVAGCQNTIIPEGVTGIGNYAFYNCTGLTSIAIPDSVTSIGDYAFSSCTGLTSITIGSGVTSIGTSAFADCTGLKSITIPNSVTSIGNRAFKDCTGLTSITFEDTDTWYVGSSAGATDTQVDVTDASTNATYLKSTYLAKYWTKK